LKIAAANADSKRKQTRKPFYTEALADISRYMFVNVAAVFISVIASIRREVCKKSGVKPMTAKEAIKARCVDCKESPRSVCKIDSCPLKGLTVAQKGARRAKAIREYCKWCLCGNSFTICVSVNCPIYVYRKKLDKPGKP